MVCYSTSVNDTLSIRLTIIKSSSVMDELPGASSIMRGLNCSHLELKFKQFKLRPTSVIESFPHLPSSTMSLRLITSVWVFNFFSGHLGKLDVLFPFSYEERKNVHNVNKKRSVKVCYRFLAIVVLIRLSSLCLKERRLN